MGAIYLLRDPRDNQVRYVGCASNVARRYYAHLSEGRRAGLDPQPWRSDKNVWLAGLLAAGLRPEVFIVRHVPGNGRGPGGWGRRVEERWIRKLRSHGVPLLNMNPGPNGRRKVKPWKPRHCSGCGAGDHRWPTCPEDRPEVIR